MLATYVRALHHGTPQKVTGLCGRIIRGKQPADFLTLTDDPTRKLVLLMGPDGLEKLLGKSGYDMLVEIGYETAYIDRKVAEGNRFKLIVFPEGGPAKLATWENVLDVVGNVYPNVASKLARHAHGLIHTDFAEIEHVAGFNFSAVDKAGPTDPRYMTEERFRQSAGTLVDARAFLYFTVHLRELFSGDGYTYTADGRRGLMEYIVANKPIADLGSHEIIDLTITLPTQQNQRSVALHKTYPIPTHYNPNEVGKVRQVPYEAIATSAKTYAQQHGIPAASLDKFRIAMMVIDGQNTFCIPGFELFVGGAVEDMQRTCEFIYRNLGMISEVDVTMDTHKTYQIFHAAFWVDSNGNHPPMFTMISLDDVKSGKWLPNPAMAAFLTKHSYQALVDHALHYCNKLAERNRYLLIIWPYHGMLGGIGHALVPALEEACFFHSIARQTQYGHEIKGGNPFTENYSIFGAEVLTTAGNKPIPGAQKNVAFLERLMNNDAVIIAGQAKSHCVAWTIDDLLDDINAKDPSLAKKVYLLADCTSPVITPVMDFTDTANQAFQRFKDAGMHVVQSTDPIWTWPGINLK